jgi:squalene-hopene/tetraprenyl-beta-curcumene cyclase
MKLLSVLGLAFAVALVLSVAVVANAAESSAVAALTAVDVSSGAAATKALPVTPKPEPWVAGAKDPDYVAPGTQAAIDKGIAYLKKSASASGGWGLQNKDWFPNDGATAIALLGLVRSGVPDTDPVVDKGLKFIIGDVKDDGGIHGMFPNYITSILVMTLAATGDPQYVPAMQKAVGFLKGLQWTEGHGIAQESSDFGGAGYSAMKNPDMSNEQWFLQAIRESGLSADDPAVKAALVFVKRSQAGEDARFICMPDGSFIYSPHGSGTSKAGTEEIPAGTKMPDGRILPSGVQGLKGYGSMTYAGFLSLIYAGLDKNDTRVQAALGWVKKHWTVEENPEMGKQGYYYYLMTMGKALRAYGEPVIVDDQGVKHDWRKELSAKLISLQHEDGSWDNSSDKFFEGSKNIVTAYALIALECAKSKP